MSDDIRRHLAIVIDQHHQADEYGYPVECQCGYDGDGSETWAEHLALVLSDVIVDLAGTGELLASIATLNRSWTEGP
jgi:hypothetical protein